MSERYKPRELYRAARARPFVAPIDRRDQKIQTERRQQASVRIDCKHGTPWLTCNLCSTTRRL